MFSSEAESIYKAWSSQSDGFKITLQAKASGEFDKFRKNGFDIIPARLLAYQRSKGTLQTAEQAWKLIEKFKRRQDENVAQEVLKIIQADANLKGTLAMFPASRFQNLSDDAQEVATKFDLKNLRFPKTGKVIRVEKMLGKGGMGGAVYLAKDQFDEKFAVKHFESAEYKRPGFNSNSPNGMFNKTQYHLGKYFEANLTTTCEDSLTIGRDMFLLLRLGEGRVDYKELNLADVISVFQDLGKVYQFSKRYMKVDLVQDVGVLHMDIHGENMMRFDGKLRFIDFGTAMVFNTSSDLRAVYNPGQNIPKKDWSTVQPVNADSSSPNLYYQSSELSQRNWNDPTKRPWQMYIENWQKSYREAPVVLVCKSCNRQYPPSLAITECLRCGSKKMETAKLRKEDILATAKLKGVSPGTIGDNPYAHGKVLNVNAEKYGCIVLTAVLIKEVWAATEGGKDLGMGGGSATSIVNTEAYGKARSGLHTFQAASPASGSVVELLLMWFDEMMRRLFDNETFTVQDAIAFFGGQRYVASARGRRHSVAF